jgi:Tfp pilus assembly protein FimV
MTAMSMTATGTTSAAPFGAFGTPVQPAADAVRRPVRLTRRGQLVVLLAAVVLLVVAFSVGRTASHADTAAPAGPALTQTTVQPGDTLWSVALRIAPDNDPREVIDQIRRINHLETAGLRAGQQLLLPVAA